MSEYCAGSKGKRSYRWCSERFRRLRIIRVGIEKRLPGTLRTIMVRLWSGAVQHFHFLLRFRLMLEIRTTKTRTAGEMANTAPEPSMTAAVRSCWPGKTLVSSHVVARCGSPWGVPLINNCRRSLTPSSALTMVLTEKLPGPAGMVVSLGGAEIDTE